MPCVVADTTPLFYLAALGRLTLLGDLYQQVLVPESVWREALAGDRANPGAGLALEAARTAGWLLVPPTLPTPIPHALAVIDLDVGESDALALALLLSADLVLIDELAGRAAAVHLGLQITGTVGILVEAKRRGLLPAIRPEIARLQDETTFWLSRRMERIALEMADEWLAPPPTS